MSVLTSGSTLLPAFPPSRVVAVLGFAPRSQWRVRAGFAPASSTAIAVSVGIDLSARFAAAAT